MMERPKIGDRVRVTITGTVTDAGGYPEYNAGRYVHVRDDAHWEHVMFAAESEPDGHGALQFEVLQPAEPVSWPPQPGDTWRAGAEVFVVYLGKGGSGVRVHCASNRYNARSVGDFLKLARAGGSFGLCNLSEPVLVFRPE